MNLRRILALSGVVILILMYLSTLVLAIMNHPDTGKLLMASIVCTVFVPILIHLFLMMNNVRHGKGLYDEPYSYRDKDKADNGDEKTNL